MKKNIYLLLAMLLVSLRVAAIPAIPHPMQVTQPDGSVITIQIHGDEHFHYIVTEDNYLITQKASGEYVYAEFDGEQIKPTHMLVSAPEKRSLAERQLLVKLGRNPITPKALAKLIAIGQERSKNLLPKEFRALKPNKITGEKKGIVILVEFQDKRFVSSTANQDFTNLLNEHGYNKNGGTGSARDYFIACTNGQYQPKFDVYGPYLLDNNVAYYGADGANGRLDVNVREMIVEACQKANDSPTGVDFSQYDTDSDDEVDMVFVYYAGGNQAENAGTNTVWPHKYDVYPTITLDNKRIKTYACTSERNGYGTMCGVGTFCHEYGHVLGLPDYYDTKVTTNFTIGSWDIMASGGYNNQGRTPPTWASYSRFYLDYMTPTLLKDPGEQVLDPIQTSNKAYLISPPNDMHNLDGDDPNPRYYYLIENRQYLDWDTVAGNYNYISAQGRLGKGLLISRINFDPIAWGDNTPNTIPGNLRVDIIEADGTEESYTGDTYPGANDVSTFSPKKLDGSVYDGELQNIFQEADGSVSFCFRDCINSTNIKVNPTKTNFYTEVGGDPDYTQFTIIGSKLAGGDIAISFSGLEASYFKVRKSGDANWVKSINITPDIAVGGVQNDSVNQVIEVAYIPTEPSFQKTHNAVFLAKHSTSNARKSVALTGKSIMKVKVVPPVMTNFTDTTANSATANWKKVADATGYYVSVYQKNGSTTEKQTFDNFAKGLGDGWNQNFYTYTTLSVPNVPAAQITSTKDTIWSAYYPQPINQVKFWIRNASTTQSGKLMVDALNDANVWENVVSQEISATLDKKTITQTVDINKKYKRLRIYTQGTITDIAIDDIETSFAANMLVSRKFVEGGNTLSTSVNGLPANSVMYGRVQATDKTSDGKTNNVTDFSNEVELKTLAGSSTDNPRALAVGIDANGDVVVTLAKEDLDKDLYVYTFDGRLIKVYYKDSYNGSTNITLKGLPKSTMLFISLGAERKGKFAKVYSSGAKVQ